MTNHNDPRHQLRRLSALYIEDLLTTPDTEILAEAAADSSVEEAGRAAQAAYQAAVKEIGQKRLQAARQAMEKERQNNGRRSSKMDAGSARLILQRISANDAEFSKKVTLAARNFQELTDAEVLEIVEDLQRLGALDKEDHRE